MSNVRPHKMTKSDNWPEDANGDVLRRLKEAGFNFSVPHEIEFNVDFTSWPPPQKSISWLRSNYQSVTVYEPDAEFRGYALFTVVAPVTYEFVVSTQAQVSNALSPEGGICESWGLLH